ncbi:MAG: hypothetical protein QE495_13770 [Acidovorax sp.]|uniref:hypothetical protein n=1 Tax=Acidovorax sp. TaxID=1872122 RepID=UPI00261B0E4C|nr:hypothetical protein [Acidovorax sp.]MDH4427516.1 hypothetical protein [Acidovorax sp.]
MSVIKSFAHLAHHSLSSLAPHALKRGHIYELMAAGLGFKSWASLVRSYALVDTDDPNLPSGCGRNLFARALQLGLSEAEAAAVMERFQTLFRQQPFGCLAFKELDKSLFPSLLVSEGGLDWDSPDCVSHSDADADENRWDTDGSSPAKRGFSRSSELLLADLGDRAKRGDVLCHYRLAKLLECKVPSDYLYQEQLKGRVLVAQELRWVENYLQLREQHAKYLKHLVAAADGGVRAAAVDYAAATGNVEYRLRAEHMQGSVNLRLMAESAPDWDTRRDWLWRLVQNGDNSALHQLAAEGDQEAVYELAVLERANAVAGDVSLIRGFAADALSDKDATAAWKWQFVANHYGLDLTRSSLRAYHDGGLSDGGFYDSDFGGPMFVAGDEGLELPAITEEQKRIAKALAEQLLSEAR